MKHETLARTVFPQDSLDRLRAVYPNGHTALGHTLDAHPLLELGALADLAESLPESLVEYNVGALPIGIKAEDVPANGLGIAETIRRIDEVGSWAVLKHIERDPRYGALLKELLAEIAPIVKATTGPMLKPEAYVFISSPNAVTPFHFDPEHNILLQVRGSKDFHVFPMGDTRFAADMEHERYHRGGHRNLPWQEGFSDEGEVVALHPGTAIYVPVMAPHYVQNGPASSLSLSITWRSEWSIEAARARAFRGRLRSLGLKPGAPAVFPGRNRVQATVEKVLRRIGR